MGPPEGGNQDSGPHSDPAFEFWSRGVAKCKALEQGSSGNDKVCDSTAFIKKEPANPSAKRDTAKSAAIHSSDQSDQSRILSLANPDSTSALSTGMDHRARQVPISSSTMSDEISPRKDEPLYRQQVEILKNVAPEIEEREKSSELEAKNCRSRDSASVLNTPTKSRGGSQHDFLRGADAISLHAEHTGHATMSHMEIEDSLLSRRGTGEPKPAASRGLNFGSKIPSRLSGTPRLSHPKQRRDLNTPPEPSPISENNELLGTKATSYISNPRSSIPSTPTNSLKSRHSKSLSVEVTAFHPSLRSYSSNETMKSCSNDRNASIGTRNIYSDPRCIPAMPKTPLQQRRLGHSREASMGRPSVPVESSVFIKSGSSPHKITHPHYPKPHLHIPEGQGQVFGIQGSIPPKTQAHIPYSFGPIMPPHFPSMRSFDNTIHQNAQIYEQGEQNSEYSQSNHFDTYATSQAANAATNAADLHQNGNMFTQDTNGYGARYFSNHTDPARQVHRYPLYIDHVRLKKTQLNQNLYSPLEPHRESSKSNHRTGRDMFIPEDIRLKLHTRTEATLRVFAGRLF